MIDRKTTRAAYTIYDYWKIRFIAGKIPVGDHFKKGTISGIYNRLFHPPNYASPASVPIIRTIIIGVSGKMVSNQLTMVSRQKDSWCFYNETINVSCNV